MSDHTLPLFSLQPETKEIPLTQGKFAIVDAADYEWLTQYKWFACKSGYTWYAARSMYLPGGIRPFVLMHREILDAPPGVEVDHRNTDGLDNRRDNLRLATHSQNAWNSRLSTRNKSGFKGVWWSKATQKWRVYISANGKRMYLGSYDTAEEAARVYDQAALQLHGEYARTNSE